LIIGGFARRWIRTNEESRMIRIAQFSDLHYSDALLDEADRCFSFAVDEAIRRGVEVAVVSGDSTDHALDVHNPAVARLAANVRRLADHCPVLMLQGTFSHEPPGTLSIFRLLGGRFPVHVADRIGQVALSSDDRWVPAGAWRFEDVPPETRALFSCIPTVNKAAVAATVDARDAGAAIGNELAQLLAGFAAINERARAAHVPTIGVSHGTVTGCITEHGVPMAGFDHEFTSDGLFAAQVQAFMLGHIHRHQCWERDGRLVAYAGSIGRFHYGEEGDKGFLLWDVGAAVARLELVRTPARRTVDLTFDGKPDLERIREAVNTQDLDGAFVRVRWVVADEERGDVDRAAIERELAGAAEVKLEGRVVPVVRSRAAGISRATSLAEKVRAWAALTGSPVDSLLDCLAALTHLSPEQIADKVLGGQSGARMDGPRPSIEPAATQHSDCMEPESLSLF
jgi:exonuclease SbcD